MAEPNSVEQLLRSLHPASGRSDVHDVDPGSDRGGTDGPREESEQPSLAAPASSPAPTRNGGLDMYERDLLETVSRFVESTGLGYHLGAAVERILHAPGQGRDAGRPLREAMWLLERHIEIVERRPVGADLHVAAERLARSGDVIAELKALAGEFDSRPATPPAGGTAPAPRAVDPPAAVDPLDRVAAAAPGAFGVVSPPASALASAETPAAGGAPARSAEVDAAGAAADEEPEEHYPLHRELAVMAFRWALMVVAVIAIVLAATLIAGWR